MFMWGIKTRIRKNCSDMCYLDTFYQTWQEARDFIHALGQGKEKCIWDDWNYLVGEGDDKKLYQIVIVELEPTKYQRIANYNTTQLLSVDTNFVDKSTIPGIHLPEVMCQGIIKNEKRKKY